MKWLLTMTLLWTIILAQNDMPILILNDVHLDLNYDEKVSRTYRCQKGKAREEKIAANFGRRGCDSPKSLFILALEHASKKLNLKPELILVPGDLVSHWIPLYGKEDYNLTRHLQLFDYMDTHAQLIQEYFPDSRIMFTHGNDDSIYDYQAICKENKTMHYKALFEIWVNKIKKNSELNTTQNRNTFFNHGSYIMDIGDNLRVISFNSLYFGKRNVPDDSKAIVDLGLFLIDALNQTRSQGKKAILMYHLPHGHLVSVIDSESYLTKEYNEFLQGLLYEYRDDISIIITGHTHIGHYKIITLDQFVAEAIERGQNAGHPKFYGNMLSNRAISPIFNNNPGFSVMYYDKAHGYPLYVKEYTFYIDKTYGKLPGDPEVKWEFLYDSREDLHIKDLSPEGLADFFEKIIMDESLLTKYLFFKLGFHPRDAANPNYNFSATASQIKENVCKSISSLSPTKDFLMCLESLSTLL